MSGAVIRDYQNGNPGSNEGEFLGSQSERLTLFTPLLIFLLSLLNLSLSLLGKFDTATPAETNGFPLFISGFFASPLWTLVRLYPRFPSLLLGMTFRFQAFKSGVFLLLTLTLLPTLSTHGRESVTIGL